MLTLLKGPVSPSSTADEAPAAISYLHPDVIREHVNGQTDPVTEGETGVDDGVGDELRDHQSEILEAPSG